MSFFAAWRFLTILPSPRRGFTPQEVGRSLGYFPLVGLSLGAILAGLDRVLGLAIPLPLVNAILILALIVLTGGLHLDGLIDTCDGLAGGRTPQQRWEMMKDSRVGSFGVAGAFSILLLKYVSLESLPQAFRLQSLLLFPALSRWALVFAVFAFPYAKPEGLGRAFKEHAGLPGLLLATAIALGLSLALLKFSGIALFLGVSLVSAALGLLLRRHFAGLTGDSYGAINEVAEVSALILLPLALRWV